MSHKHYDGFTVLQLHFLWVWIDFSYVAWWYPAVFDCGPAPWLPRLEALTAWLCPKFTLDNLTPLPSVSLTELRIKGRFNKPMRPAEQHAEFNFLQHWTLACLECYFSWPLMSLSSTILLLMHGFRSCIRVSLIPSASAVTPGKFLMKGKHTYESSLILKKVVSV